MGDFVTPKLPQGVRATPSTDRPAAVSKTGAMAACGLAAATDGRQSIVAATSSAESSGSCIAFAALAKSSAEESSTAAAGPGLPSPPCRRTVTPLC